MLKIYSKDFATEYGTLDTLAKALVEEERNGLFELSFTMLNTDSLFKFIEKENIVVANANDTLINQKFRIYNIRKLMNNRVEIYARHISFDLMYDYIDNFQCTNQSCQYVLNQLFLNSNFSKNYKGYSDIVNAQNYKISMTNILEAIGGKSGSVLDTFGTGADLLRDNENIHVLNRRGNDNLVSIEYKKNLTGIELEEDTSDLITRILPYAKYTPDGGEEVTVKGNYVDSPLISNYSHPYIKSIDYSEEFDDGEVPTISKLTTHAQNEYKNNKVDIPKQNFKIDFIPLSKCVGYEGISDKISLCDIVTIKDTRYNVDTKAKVIKTVFNVLKNRYESIELGEPRTSLNDVVGGGGNEVVVGPPGPPGPPGEDGNIGNFPDSLPTTPILENYVYGFSTIELSWSFESKIYYQYELYASKIKDFIPNAFDLIHQGQSSSFLFQAKPNETWYFKVCGINSYGKRTVFSNQVEAKTTKIDDLSNYVNNMAIGDALIGTLRLDRGWIGKLNANVLDVKGNFSVTDGNGKRTLDIDSFGNIIMDVTSLKISAKNVATDESVAGKADKNSIISTINQSAESVSISANKINLTGDLELQGQFKCWASNSNKTGAYLYSNGAMIRGYKDTSQAKPTFASGLWYGMGNSSNTPLGYVSVGITNAIDSDNNGCLWMSPKWDSTNNWYGTTLSYSRKLDSNGQYVRSGIDFNQNGKVEFSCFDDNKQTSGYAGYLFDAGLSCYSLNSWDIYCRALRSRAIYPENTGYYNIGNSSSRYISIYLNNAPNVTSDSRLKEDVKYLNDRSINETDMYDFVKNDLNLVEYKLIAEKDKQDNKNIGFIAQDILYTKVGSEIVKLEDANDLESELSYNQGNYISVLSGALKKAIDKIEHLEKEIEVLKSN